MRLEDIQVAITLPAHVLGCLGVPNDIIPPRFGGYTSVGGPVGCGQKTVVYGMAGLHARRINHVCYPTDVSKTDRS